MANATIFFFTCADGHKMPVHQWLPAGPCKLVLLIAHGMAEHGSRYARFANALNNAGIAVYANDHRGHGLAVADKTSLGVPGADWFNRQVADLHGLVTRLKKENVGLFVVLMGHSMGSFLAQRFAQLHGSAIDALILSGTNGQKDPLLPVGIGLSGFLMRLRGPAFKSSLLHTLTFGKFNRAFQPARTEFDWLSRDQKEVDAYINDPLCGGRSSVQLMYHLFVALNQTFSSKAISQIPKALPVYAFAGDKDPVGFEGKGVRKLISNWKNGGIKNIDLNLYENGRHEMLNEINRTEVTADCLRWIEKQVSK